MRMAAIRPASLDAPIGDEDSNNFAEVVQDENADTPYEQLEGKTVTKMLQEMVKTLDHREATILRARFGLDGGPEKTLEEVGAEVWRHPRARAPDSEHRAEEAAQDD